MNDIKENFEKMANIAEEMQVLISKKEVYEQSISEVERQIELLEKEMLETSKQGIELLKNIEE